MNAEYKGAIGIDFGSSFCRAAVWNKDHVEVIADENGNTAIPFCISFSKSSKPIIGEPNESANSSGYDVKRLLGRKFADCELQKDLKYLQFKITNKNEFPNVHIDELELDLSPEEIAAMMIFKLKQMAEKHLGMIVKKTVISVPAMFGDVQRRAVKNAAVIAGLDVLRITTDPCATAIMYSRTCNTRERNAVILDFGATKLDVASMTIEDGIIEVRAVAGSCHFGGIDIDHKMIDHCVETIKKTHNVDVRTSPLAMRKLKAACEKAKIHLSTATTTTIQAESLVEDVNLNLKLSRDAFEEMNKGMLQKAVQFVTQATSSLGASIRDVVIVGGSSRIPKVRHMLRELFEGKELNTFFDTGESVVQGAAICAALLTGEPFNTLILDVYPYNVGLDHTSGVMTVLINRNTSIPCKKTQVFTTDTDHSYQISMAVYEGEKSTTKDNNLVGHFELQGFIPAPRGVPQIEVSFIIDANGLLNVFACDKLYGKGPSIVTTRQPPLLCYMQLEEMHKRIVQLMMME